MIFLPECNSFDLHNLPALKVCCFMLEVTWNIFFPNVACQACPALVKASMVTSILIFATTEFRTVSWRGLKRSGGI